MTGTVWVPNVGVHQWLQVIAASYGVMAAFLPRGDAEVVEFPAHRILPEDHEEQPLPQPALVIALHYRKTPAT